MLLVSTNGPHGERFAQHRAAIDSAARAGVGHLASTSVISNAPPVIRELEEQTKAAIEATGIPYTFLRNGLHSENYMSSLPSSVSTSTLTSAAGTGRVVTAARDDLALAAAVVLTTGGHEGAAYELTRLRAWFFDELAALTSALAGRPIGHRCLGTEELAAARLAAGTPEFAVRAVVGIFAVIAQGTLATVASGLEKVIRRKATAIEESVLIALGT
jgi:NAD(P)H dehydrogenase (quinone)